MPEGVIDGGQAVGSGHESGRRASAKRRPDDVPAGWVFDRRDRRWREPRKPGPKPADEDLQDNGPADGSTGGGWQADRDPDPAHLAGEPGPGRGPRTEPPDEVKADVAGLLGLLAVPIGTLAERRDPYCGAVFAGQLPAIVGAAVPIVCRSERVVRWMTAPAGGLLDWVGLATAMAPVAAAVLQHHVVKTVRLEQEEEPAGESADVYAGA